MDDELKITAQAFKANSPLLIADQNQIIIKANDAYLSLGGYSSQTTLGASLKAFYSTTENKFSPYIDEGFTNLLADPERHSFFSGKTVRLSKQGVEVHAIETVTIVKDEIGKPVNYVVNFHEVTELVKTEKQLRESQETYFSLFESIHDGVLMLDENRVIACNGQFARMMSSDRASLVGRSIAELSIPIQADGSVSKAKAEQVFSSVVGGRPDWIEWTLRRPDGRPMEVEASLGFTTFRGKGIVLATVRDITARKLIDRERKILLDELADKEELIRLAGKASKVASWLLNVDTEAIIWSDGAAEFLGFERIGFGDSLADIKSLMSIDQKAEFEQVLADVLNTGESMKFESGVRLGQGPDAEYRWFNTLSQAELDDQNQVVRIRGTVSDVSDQRKVQQEIERLAYYDPLTGLANRRLLLDRLEQCCAQAERRGTSGALLFIDLDRFKLLNDSLGHKVGDELLQEVGKRLQQSLRKEDVVARLGGDEFVVLLPSIEGDSNQVASRVRRVSGLVRRALAKGYQFENHTYHMSGSIGVAIFPQDSSTADSILQQADAAMYLAKKSGRDSVAFYHASLQSETDKRLRLERGLRNAVDQGELELYFQPQVDTNRGGQVTGAEALLRWHHPEDGMIMPDAFISIAEETGLILSLGKWVLDRACEQFVQWNDGRDQHEKLRLSVNVSPVQFRHRSFVGDVKHIIERRRIDPKLVTLEITESVFIDNLEDTRIKFQQLRQFGVRLSIDDFGTGYSSLSFLKDLPLDELKIDRSYVKNVINDPSGAAIVASILDIAKHLQLDVVAEGVETKEQAAFLKSIGSSVNQGYLYSAPIPAEQFAMKYLTASLVADFIKEI